MKGFESSGRPVSSSALSARSWRVDGFSPTPALAVAGSSLPWFTCFPALGLLLLSWGHILWEKYEYSELRTVLPPWGLWVLWAPPPESWIYMLWGIQIVNRRIPARSSVAIARSSDGASWMTARESPDGRQAWALYRHRQISVRWPRWHRAVIARRLPDLCSMTCWFFPLHFGRWPPRSPLDDRTVSHGAPPDEEKWGGIRRWSGKF